MKVQDVEARLELISELESHLITPALNKLAMDILKEMPMGDRLPVLLTKDEIGMVGTALCCAAVESREYGHSEQANMFSELRERRFS